MADSNLLETYNPLYDVHLRSYFASPHMQKHLRSLGLLDSNGVPIAQQDNNVEGQLYARHQVMMDMMLRNRERVLMQLADLQKKLDAAEKVEIYRRIRSGITNAEEFKRHHLTTRSFSRPARGRARDNDSNDRQRRNSYDESELVKRIENDFETAQNQEHKGLYNRLAANAYKYQYLHKLDDRTLINYKESLRRQLQKLERFREVSFGPHSVARHQPNLQTSWFFRRRSLPSLTTANTTSSGATARNEKLINLKPQRNSKSVNRQRAGKSCSPHRANRLPAATQSQPAQRKSKPKQASRKLPPLPKQQSKTKTHTSSSSSAATQKLPPTAVVKPSKKREKEDHSSSGASVDKLPQIAAAGVLTSGVIGAATALTVQSDPEHREISDTDYSRPETEASDALPSDAEMSMGTSPQPHSDIEPEEPEPIHYEPEPEMTPKEEHSFNYEQNSHEPVVEDPIQKIVHEPINQTPVDEDVTPVEEEHIRHVRSVEEPIEPEQKEELIEEPTKHEIAYDSAVYSSNSNPLQEAEETPRSIAEHQQSENDEETKSEATHAEHSAFSPRSINEENLDAVSPAYEPEEDRNETPMSKDSMEPDHNEVVEQRHVVEEQETPQEEKHLESPIEQHHEVEAHPESPISQHYETEAHEEIQQHEVEPHPESPIEHRPESPSIESHREAHPDEFAQEHEESYQPSEVSYQHEEVRHDSPVQHEEASLQHEEIHHETPVTYDEQTQQPHFETEEPVQHEEFRQESPIQKKEATFQHEEIHHETPLSHDEPVQHEEVRHDSPVQNEEFRQELPIQREEATFQDEEIHHETPLSHDEQHFENEEPVQHEEFRQEYPVHDEMQQSVYEEKQHDQMSQSLYHPSDNQESHFGEEETSSVKNYQNSGHRDSFAESESEPNLHYQTESLQSAPVQQVEENQGHFQNNFDLSQDASIPVMDGESWRDSEEETQPVTGPADGDSLTAVDSLRMETSPTQIESYEQMAAHDNDSIQHEEYEREQESHQNEDSHSFAESHQERHPQEQETHQNDDAHSFAETHQNDDAHSHAENQQHEDVQMIEESRDNVSQHFSHDSENFEKPETRQQSAHLLAQPSIEITPASEYSNSQENLERIGETATPEMPKTPSSISTQNDDSGHPTEHDGLNDSDNQMPNDDEDQLTPPSTGKSIGHDDDNKYQDNREDDIEVIPPPTRHSPLTVENEIQSSQENYHLPESPDPNAHSTAIPEQHDEDLIVPDVEDLVPRDHLPEEYDQQHFDEHRSRQEEFSSNYESQQNEEAESHRDTESFVGQQTAPNTERSFEAHEERYNDGHSQAEEMEFLTSNQNSNQNDEPMDQFNDEDRNGNPVETTYQHEYQINSGHLDNAHHHMEEEEVFNNGLNGNGVASNGSNGVHYHEESAVDGHTLLIRKSQGDEEKSDDEGDTGSVIIRGSPDNKLEHRVNPDDEQTGASQL